MVYNPIKNNNQKDKSPLENRIFTLKSSDLKDNRPEYVVLHSTHKHKEFDDVLAKHLSRRWAGVGYHVFLSQSHIASQSRPFDKEGAHALGFNTRSIGMCIFSDNSKTESKSIEKGIEIIDYINSGRTTDLPIISHTQAQVMYINQLLKEHGLEQQFASDITIVRENDFKLLKKDIYAYVGSLSTQKYYSLKQRMKRLINCPGKLVYYFI